MTPEPFEEFRYSGCGTSSHSLQPIVLCLWLPLSFDLELQLCLASGAVGVISLGTVVCYTADVVCWRKRFSPQTLGLLQVLFLHRISPEAYDLLAVVPSF